jgi:CBS domain-containing protein
MMPVDLQTVVTYNPLSLSADTTWAELLPQWNTIEYHPWPIVDEDQRLVGILSFGDMVRAIQAEVEGGHVAVAVSGGGDFLSDHSVREIMTTRLVTVPTDEEPVRAFQLLLEHRFQSLPVVDGQRLVGMITTADFLREFSYGSSTRCRSPAVEFVESVAEPIDCSASLEEAAAVMLQVGAGYLGVVRGNLPLGVVTRRDIHLAQYRADARRLLHDVCDLPGPVTIQELAAQLPLFRPGGRLSEAAALMAAHQRGALAVVNQAGRLVGVLTEAGVLGAMEGSGTWAVGSR